MSGGPVDRDLVRRVVVETIAEVAGAGGAGASTSGPTVRARGAASPAAGPGRTIAIGGDHGGFRLKESLRRYLEEELGWRVIDHGARSEEPVDYPDIALAVARSVVSGEAARGLVIDGAGIGSTMAANKVHGILAALCHDERTARNAREHNDANVLVLGSGSVGRGLARSLVRIFLSTPFGGGRHERRVRKILAIEEGAVGAAPREEMR